MAALIKDRNTQMQDSGIVSVPVAANARIFAGAIVVANAAGFAAPGSTATGLAYVGRAEEYMDNTGGANGAKRVKVRRLCSFKWGNDGSITQAHLLRNCYIVDDQTVAATDGTGTRSLAGKIVGVDADGIWVE